MLAVALVCAAIFQPAPMFCHPVSSFRFFLYQGPPVSARESHVDGNNHDEVRPFLVTAHVPCVLRTAGLQCTSICIVNERTEQNA